MKRLRLAAWGIDCREYGSYKVTMEQDVKAAESLVPWYRSMGWIGETEGAEAVLRKKPLCKGCWIKTDQRVFSQHRMRVFMGT